MFWLCIGQLRPALRGEESPNTALSFDREHGSVPIRLRWVEDPRFA